MHSKNEVELSFDARSVNEGFARMAVAAFITELNPTMDELSDVKTAVSEAVTNAIIHGYDNPEEKVHICLLYTSDAAGKGTSVRMKKYIGVQEG